MTKKEEYLNELSKAKKSLEQVESSLSSINDMSTFESIMNDVFAGFSDQAVKLTEMFEEGFDESKSICECGSNKPVDREVGDERGCSSCKPNHDEIICEKGGRE